MNVAQQTLLPTRYRAAHTVAFGGVTLVLAERALACYRAGLPLRRTLELEAGREAGGALVLYLHLLLLLRWSYADERRKHGESEASARAALGGAAAFGVLFAIWFLYQV